MASLISETDSSTNAFSSPPAFTSCSAFFRARFELEVAREWTILSMFPKEPNSGMMKVPRTVSTLGIRLLFDSRWTVSPFCQSNDLVTCFWKFITLSFLSSFLSLSYSGEESATSMGGFDRGGEREGVSSTECCLSKRVEGGDPSSLALTKSEGVIIRAENIWRGYNEKIGAFFAASFLRQEFGNGTLVANCKFAIQFVELLRVGENIIKNNVFVCLDRLYKTPSFKVSLHPKTLNFSRIKYYSIPKTNYLSPLPQCTTSRRRNWSKTYIASSGVSFCCFRQFVLNQEAFLWFLFYHWLSYPSAFFYFEKKKRRKILKTNLFCVNLLLCV